MIMKIKNNRLQKLNQKNNKKLLNSKKPIKYKSSQINSNSMKLK